MFNIFDYVNEDLFTINTTTMLDIKAAFDNVNRKELKLVMSKMGFPKITVRWTVEFTK